MTERSQVANPITRPVAILLAIGLFLSLALNVGLGVRHRQLQAHYGLVKVLARLPQSGQQYPSFDGIRADGSRVLIGESSPGTRQLIFVLNRTCPFCAETIPVWRSLIAEFANDSAIALTVYALVTDSVEATKQYLDSLAFPATVAGFPDRRTLRLARATQVPQTLLLDDDGWIRYAHIGVFSNRLAIDSVRSAVASPTPLIPASPSGVGTSPEGSSP